MPAGHKQEPYKVLTYDRVDSTHCIKLSFRVAELSAAMPTCEAPKQAHLHSLMPGLHPLHPSWSVAKFCGLPTSLARFSITATTQAPVPACCSLVCCSCGVACVDCRALLSVSVLRFVVPKLVPLLVDDDIAGEVVRLHPRRTRTCAGLCIGCLN